MSVIDPDLHAHLIQLQQAVNTAFEELHAFTGEAAEPLREEVRQIVMEKDEALYASGLPEEHGYYAASQDLKDAARG